MSRSEETAESLSRQGAEPVPGDILHPAALDALVEGVEVVFNVAGVNELCPANPGRMFEVNVSGARNVIEAAERAGVRRLVHTSSAVTIGEEHGTVGHEGAVHRGWFLSEYERSKAVSERMLANMVSNVEVVFVNPSSVQGPGRATGTGAIFLAVARGRIPVLVDESMSIVDIDDCARGHLLAAERGRPGERYLLSGAVLTVRDAVKAINDVLGRRTRPWFLRSDAVRSLIPLLEVVDPLLPGGIPVCAESLRVLLNGHRYDGSKATADLGLAYTPIETTLRRTLDWFEEADLL